MLNGARNLFVTFVIFNNTFAKILGRHFCCHIWDINGVFFPDKNANRKIGEGIGYASLWIFGGGVYSYRTS